MSRSFSGRKQVMKSVNKRESRLFLFILDNREWRTFHLQDNNGKLWVEVIVVVYFNTVATADVLKASNNDVKLGETWTVLYILQI